MRSGIQYPCSIQPICPFAAQSSDSRMGARSGLKIALFFIVFLLLSCHGAFAQADLSKSADGVEEVYLAKDDGNGKAGEQVTEFRTTDVPIYCVVLLESNSSTVVKMNFVA